MCRWLSTISRLVGLVEPAISSIVASIVTRIVTVFAVGGLATNDDRMPLTFNIEPLIVDLGVGFAVFRL